MAGDRPVVAFVCRHNAGRSQMAAALLRREGEGRVEVRSAGTEPIDRVHPVVADAMREIGIDVSGVTPAGLASIALEEADVVVTMGCGDACPVYPAARYEDWDLDDPAGKPIEEVRRIRDDIGRRVRHLLASLHPRTQGGGGG